MGNPIVLDEDGYGGDDILNKEAEKRLNELFGDEDKAKIFVLDLQMKTLVNILNILLPYVLEQVNEEERKFLLRYVSSKMSENRFFQTMDTGDAGLNRPVRYGIWASTLKDTLERFKESKEGNM